MHQCYVTKITNRNFCCLIHFFIKGSIMRMHRTSISTATSFFFAGFKRSNVLSTMRNFIQCGALKGLETQFLETWATHWNECNASQRTYTGIIFWERPFMGLETFKYNIYFLHLPTTHQFLSARAAAPIAVPCLLPPSSFSDALRSDDKTHGTR